MARWAGRETSLFSDRFGPATHALPTGSALGASRVTRSASGGVAIFADGGRPRRASESASRKAAAHDGGVVWAAASEYRHAWGRGASADAYYGIYPCSAGRRRRRRALLALRVTSVQGHAFGECPGRERDDPHGTRQGLWTDRGESSPCEDETRSLMPAPEEAP